MSGSDKSNAHGTVREAAEEAAKLGQAKFLSGYPEPWLVQVGVTGEALRVETPMIGDETITATGERVNLWLPRASLAWRVVKRNAMLPDRVTVGRGSENDVVIAEPSVSQLHAWFLPGDDEYLLVDAASKNGTRVDNQICEAEVPVPVHDVQTIRFGGTVRVLYVRSLSLWTLAESGLLDQRRDGSGE